MSGCRAVCVVGCCACTPRGPSHVQGRVGCTSTAAAQASHGGRWRRVLTCTYDAPVSVACIHGGIIIAQERCHRAFHGDIAFGTFQLALCHVLCALSRAGVSLQLRIAWNAHGWKLTCGAVACCVRLTGVPVGVHPGSHLARLACGKSGLVGVLVRARTTCGRRPPDKATAEWGAAQWPDGAACTRSTRSAVEWAGGVTA